MNKFFRSPGWFYTWLTLGVAAGIYGARKMADVLMPEKRDPECEDISEEELDIDDSLFED